MAGRPLMRKTMAAFGQLFVGRLGGRARSLSRTVAQFTDIIIFTASADR